MLLKYSIQYVELKLFGGIEWEYVSTLSFCPMITLAETKVDVKF